MNNKGFSMAVAVVIIVLIGGAIYLLSPLVVDLLSGTNDSLFINASLSGMGAIETNQVMNYENEIGDDEARIYSFTSLDIARFDHDKYDEDGSYVLVVKKGKDDTSFDYYINFRTLSSENDYRQLVMVKREDVKWNVITYDKEGWIEKPKVGSTVIIEKKEYKVIE